MAGSRTRWVGALLAAALLAGCSSATDDATTTSSTARADTSASGTAVDTTSGAAATSSEVAATTATGDDPTADDTTGVDPTDDNPEVEDDTAEDTGSIQPVTLDDASKVWFGTFCTGLSGAFTGMAQTMSGAMGDGSTDVPDPKATQAALVSGYQQVAAAFSRTASDLSALPAPTVAEGDRLAADLAGALDALGEGFATATGKLAAADVTDDASLSAALDAFSTETAQYNDELQTQFSGLDTTLTPEIGVAVQALPECEILAS